MIDHAQTHAIDKLGLDFPTASRALSFLLTCLEGDGTARGTRFFDESFARFYVHKRSPQTVHLRVSGEPSLLKTVVEMATANGGANGPLRDLPAPDYWRLTLDQVLRSACLRPASARGTFTGPLLVVLWRASGELLADFARFVWNVGARGVEVAFSRADAGSAPSHLVRIVGLRHPESFRAWSERQEAQVEVYRPAGGDRGSARFFIPWGYHFPLPGLERLAAPESELVLMRPQGENTPPKWMVFRPGQLNFFRLPYEVFDLQITHETQPLELVEDTRQSRVPLELTIVPRPNGGPVRLWQIDREIERRRRALGTIEQKRARLSTGQNDEVNYFAYRFDQPDRDWLNPLLLRLMQQRLATLAQYEYAYCQPSNQAPYHLVIAKKPQSRLDFSLQIADRVYCQPVPWRQWGLNLFLPLDMELHPRIESEEAVPLLLSWLDPSVNPEAPSAKPATDYAMILWERGPDDAIVETRVQELVPLLSRHRLLNAFQRCRAADIESATRQQLLDGLYAARDANRATFDAIEQELLEHVETRTAALEDSYGNMERQLRGAERLVEQVEPKLGEVTKLILNLPDEWVGYVNRVIGTHKQLSDPAIEGYEKLRALVRRGREELRALAASSHNLAALAGREKERIGDRTALFDSAFADADRQLHEVEDLARRMAKLLAEIAQAHVTVAERVRRVKTDAEKADKMQSEIDEIDLREKEVRARLETLRGLHAQAEKTSAEVEAKRAIVETEERALLRRGEELATRRQKLRENGERCAEQLLRVQQQLAVINEQSTEVERVFELFQQQVDKLDAHTDAVKQWQERSDAWRAHLHARQEEATDQIGRLRDVEY